MYMYVFAVEEDIAEKFHVKPHESRGNESKKFSKN